MKLAEQIRRLASVGIPLNDGITEEDFLISFDREAYESKPYERVLWRMGGEVEAPPWGRLISDRVWSFDTECVHGPGAYVNVLERLVAMARADDRIEEIEDDIDFDRSLGFLRYTIDGEPRQWDVEVNDDWADLMVVSYAIDDLEGNGYKFARRDDGQSVLIVYLDRKKLKDLNATTGLGFEWFVPD
jgi:hypothetical protein